MDTQTLMAALSRATVERMQVQDALAAAQARIAELEAEAKTATADKRTSRTKKDAADVD